MGNTASLSDTETQWRAYLTGEKLRSWRFLRQAQARLPGSERCKNCNAPFTGPAKMPMRLLGRGRYRHNPRFCNT